MPKKEPAPIDPELERQLVAAVGNHPVEVVFTLRTTDEKPLLNAGEVQRKVERIIESAQTTAGEKVCDLHVLPLVQSFVLAAPAAVVRAILASDEIASALANAQSEDLPIEPVPARKATSRSSKPRKGKD